MKKAVLLVVLALPFLCSAVSAQENWKAVRASSLHLLFADHEFADGVHFAYRFRADGTFSGTEMAKDVRGKWRVSGREVCWTWIRPPGAEECYVVRKNGAEVSLLRNGSEQWWGTLKPVQSGRP